jgi:Spy/CpxP family protein refolding chaperone
MKHWIAIVCLSLASVVAASAQPPAAGRSGADATVSPGELQRMFDAYALMQAQDQLKIDDEHYAQFLTRFKALQDVRRRALQERTRTIGELRRLGNDPQADEGQIKDRLKALQEIDAQSLVDIRKAYDAVDQILNVHQQAKFRAFEEMMERRKLELVSRARQANRPKKQL